MVSAVNHFGYDLGHNFFFGIKRLQAVVIIFLRVCHEWSMSPELGVESGWKLIFARWRFKLAL